MGAGKTSLILHLCSMGFGHPIPVFTTRTQRPAELEKVSISLSTFEKLIELDMFYSVSTVKNHMYGNLKDSINGCTSNTKRIGYLDLSIKQLPDFSGLSTLKILILPANGDQLRDQLRLSNRHDRIDGAKSDFDEHLAFQASVINHPDWFIVKNLPNQLEEIALPVKNFICRYLYDS